MPGFSSADVSLIDEYAHWLLDECKASVSYRCNVLCASIRLVKFLFKEQAASSDHLVKQLNALGSIKALRKALAGNKPHLSARRFLQEDHVYSLREDECNPQLQADLKEFHDMLLNLMRPISAQKHMHNLRAALGWLVNVHYKGDTAKETHTKSAATVRLADLLPSAATIGAELAFRFVQWLRWKRRVRPAGEQIVLGSFKRLAQFLFQSTCTKSPYLVGSAHWKESNFILTSRMYVNPFSWARW